MQAKTVEPTMDHMVQMKKRIRLLKIVCKCNAAEEAEFSKIRLTSVYKRDSASPKAGEQRRSYEPI